MKHSLNNFKPYLDYGTNSGLRYNDESKSRYVSFNICLEYLSTINNPKILELGTNRSFVDGRFEGCNSSDTKYWEKDNVEKWDWGAGCFTTLFGLLAKNSDITSIDIMEEHIKRSKYMTNSLGIKNIKHFTSDSINFLEKTTDTYDLIYVDTGDMWPIDQSQKLQLKEVKSIINRNLIRNNGIILVDDVLNQTPKEMGDINNKLGKSDLSIPYLLENKYVIIFDGYQHILRRKT